MSDWIGGNRYLSLTEMQNNADITYGYLTTRGVSFNAVCALCGNMQSESTINPNIWENLTVNIERGYGLVQWTPSTKLSSWNSDYTSGYVQLDRIIYESEHGLQWFENPKAPIIYPPITLAEFLHSDLDVVTLANYFLWYYEHPAETIQPERGRQAQYWANYLSDTPIPPIPPIYRNRKKIIFYLKNKI